MFRSKSRLAPLGVALSATLLWGCDAADKADLVILNADVHTMEAGNPRAQAVAVRGERILYVGDDQGAEQWVGAQTNVVNAHGATLLPGLIDTHIHPATSAVQMDDCTLEDRELSLAQIGEVVAECMAGGAALPAGQIFQVINLNPANFAASAADLDKISRQPLALFGSDGHTAWANSAALALAGIDRDTADPATGHVVRDEAGEPTGQLVDDATQYLQAYLQEDDFDTRVEMTAQALQLMHGVGLTSLMEAAATEEELKVYRALADGDRLTMHTTVALLSRAENTADNLQNLLRLREQYSGRESLQINTAKIFVDGVLEYPTQSAALLEPYLDSDGAVSANRGALYAAEQELNGLVRDLAGKDFNVHLHAIGDRAVRAGLNAFAVARGQQLHAAKFSMSHLQLIHPDDLARFGELDVFASFQLHWARPENYSVEAVQPYLGAERSEWMYPAKSLLDAGGTITGGSDWNVSTFNPFMAMAAAVCRCNFEEPERGTLMQAQGVGNADMLRAYTINAAAMLGRDGETGSLKAGKRADLILVDRDVSTADAASLRETRVLATVAAGKLVYGTL
ncbi:amidohydrolase [Microbulbifer magnicolonia]|uniref:amidohydrolase n=1 Tax=Microbulbifer magnicolonia TaxID=3109744 RepID=UPI002B40EFB7|nr:amidohydrolase [Microbulbifer sp. GG15]